MSTLVTPKGRAGWTQLHEARGFKGAEDNKKFSQDVIFSKEDGERMMAEIQPIANQLHAKELERARMKGKNIRLTPPVINYKYVDGGGMQFSFSLKETDGVPVVVAQDNQPFKGRITRETTLQIAYEVVPYVLAHVFGVTFKILAVKVLDSIPTQIPLADLFGAPAPTSEPKKNSIEDLF